MTITAADVNKLRQQTGAGLMDCKKALVESGGDFEAAIDYLRKKGQKISASRADRDAKEGVVITRTDVDRNKGIIVQISCETDFVAKNHDFVNFAQNIANVAAERFPETAEQLLTEQYLGVTIADRIDEQVGKIGEKIELKRFEKIEGNLIVDYMHANNKIGVLVALNQNTPQAEQIGRDIAMQIAAMKPIAVDKSDVEQSVIDKEMEIARDQVRQEGKPENMIDKIAEGKLQKFFKENTLLNQQFVKDNNKTIADVLKDIDKDLKVTGFKRVAIG